MNTSASFPQAKISQNKIQAGLSQYCWHGPAFYLPSWTKSCPFILLMSPILLTLSIHFLSKQAFFDFAQSFRVFQENTTCQNKLFLNSHSLFADFQNLRLGEFQKESFSQVGPQKPCPYPTNQATKKESSRIPFIISSIICCHSLSAICGPRRTVGRHGTLPRRNAWNGSSPCGDTVHGPPRCRGLPAVPASGGN